MTEGLFPLLFFFFSDLEYEWTEHPCTGVPRIILGIVSLGCLPKYFDERWNIGYIKTQVFQ